MTSGENAGNAFYIRNVQFATVRLLWPIFFLFLSLPLAAQEADTGYAKKDLSETDIQLLFSYYTQQGDHSAVTGGKGTEELQVSSPDIYIVHSIDSTKKIYANIGVDVVSSASTDKIDFHVSSASRKDMRGHLSLGYGQQFVGSGLELGMKGSLAIESDYFSRGLDFWVSSADNGENRSATFRLQAFFDDLRWGRLSQKHFLKPQKLVYPEELRYREWDSRYDRTSLNAAATLTQVVNRRIVIGIFPGVVYQYGLLSTPFHRVYFHDSGDVRVEHLPESRWKIPIGFQLNAFLGSQWIARSHYRFYWDDFGISSHTVSLEMVAKLSPHFSVAPFARLYAQSQAKYFEPYGEHVADEEYYTSDYDLSGFTSTEFGIGLRYLPFKSLLGNAFLFREVAVRYGYYRREDGLYAHLISTFFNLNAK